MVQPTHPCLMKTCSADGDSHFHRPLSTVVTVGRVRPTVMAGIRAGCASLRDQSADSVGDSRLS